jgi:hypothetical protein
MLEILTAQDPSVEFWKQEEVMFNPGERSEDGKGIFKRL